ncbi:drug/metabolite transporter (DMT)-like permease [Pseudomonas frederiksbergensis]|jgi:drug/metabolite transporter (DMT)-like permease|nr:hypothetical protein FFH90_012355 [Pseudomonas sp. ATCC 43928]CAH0234087.1 hypothetical protein SRABI130_02818 [Pseudomonas sp. Bi130]
MGVNVPSIWGGILSNDKSATGIVINAMLTEPLFAALLAFVVLNEVPRESLYAGAVLIIVGLCFSNELIRLGSKASVPSTE